MTITVKNEPPRFVWLVSGVAIAAAAGRAVALLKELVVAGRFGTGGDLEAFILAMCVPLLVAGALRSAILASLMPRLVAARQHGGKEAAATLLRSCLARHLVIAAFCSTLILALASPLVAVIAGGFSPDKRLLTEQLVRWLAPVVVFDGLAAVWTASLHANGRLFASTLGLGAGPGVTILVLMLLPGASANLLVLGAVAGSAAEAAWMAWLLHRAGESPIAWGSPWAPHASEAGRGFLTLLAGAAIVSLNPIVDQAMATHFGPGSVASLGFGGRIVSGLLALVATAIGTAALPRYSMYAAAHDFDRLRRAYIRDLLAASAVGAVLAAVLMTGSTPLVRALFERGAFSPNDTASVATIQFFSAIQIPGYLGVILGSRALNALGRDWDVLVSAAAAVLLNFAGNVVLGALMGVPGIALSTGIVYSVLATGYAMTVLSRLARGGSPQPS